jgi:signal transduction histidine kinase
VAHDLNNLFATILGCLELMERRFEDPDRLRILIKRSSDAVERAASLTSRLAQFTRRQEQPKISADIITLIADLMPLIASALGRRVRVSVHTSLTPAFAHVDVAGLEATLLALCMAVRAALPETGHVTLATQVSGSRVAVSVAVVGPGINQLDVAWARRIASAAGFVVETALALESAEIIVLLSPVARNMDANKATSRPALESSTSIKREQ